MPRLSTTISTVMTYRMSRTPAARYFCTRASSLERLSSRFKSFISTRMTTRQISSVTAAEMTLPRVSVPREIPIRLDRSKEDIYVPCLSYGILIRNLTISETRQKVNAEIKNAQKMDYEERD